MPKKVFPAISGELLESISKILADYLTHSEITKYLHELRLKDEASNLSKWKRIFNGFVLYQHHLHNSNNILEFIRRAISPHRYIDKNSEFEVIRKKINECLSFIGIQMSEDGIYRPVIKAKTILEAKQRADILESKLKSRDVHSDVLEFCKPELLHDNYFHAVFEATKSVAEKIRLKSGLLSDGSILVDAAFGLGSSNEPLLSFNNLASESELNEHKGLANIIKGLFGMFRNTLAHSPKVKWEIEEMDALDSLSLISLIHRKLDLCGRRFN